MKRYLKWTIAFLLIVLGAWSFSTLLQVVSISRESIEDRKHLNQDVKNLQAANKQFEAALSEVNRRCFKAKDCVPIETPEINIVNPDDPEIQEPEIQEREIQEPERQDPEIADGEVDDPDPDDPETQDPEIQDPEIQEPEKDDPDPASPYNFTFTFKIPGNGESGDTTYRVTCNSGTGNCTAEQI